MFEHVLGVFCGSARFKISESPRTPGGTVVRLTRTGKGGKKGTSAHIEIIGLLSPRILLISFRMRDPASLERRRKRRILCEIQCGSLNVKSKICRAVEQNVAEVSLPCYKAIYLRFEKEKKVGLILASKLCV